MLALILMTGMTLMFLNVLLIFGLDNNVAVSAANMFCDEVRRETVGHSEEVFNFFCDIVEME